MALYVNGTSIPQTKGKIIVDGVQVEKVVCDGVAVWQVSSTPSKSWHTIWSESMSITPVGWENAQTPYIGTADASISLSIPSATEKIRITGEIAGVGYTNGNYYPNTIRVFSGEELPAEIQTQISGINQTFYVSETHSTSQVTLTATVSVQISADIHILLCVVVTNIEAYY